MNSLPGCRARNNHGNAFSGAGTPDITACYRGRHIEIEVKRPGEKPKKLQLYELEKWREAGAVAVWVESLDEVKQLMEGLEHETR